VSYYPLSNLGGGFAGRRSAGEGEGVLWLHGYGLDSSSWADVWDRLPRWRHVGVDLPGHGLSEPLPPREELGALVKRLAEVARRHHARHLVGLSLGAAIALAMARECPGAFQSLTLASPLLGGPPEVEPFWKRYKEMANMYRMAGFGEHLRGRLMLVEPSAFDGVRPDTTLWDRLWRIVGRHPFWDLADAGYLRASSLEWPEEALHAVALPALVMVGELDSTGSQAAAERLVAALPSVQRVSLPGAAHLSILEAPAAGATALDAHLGAHATAEGLSRTEAGA
jgi:pimeloyl-ACP methyl ester carboxylesterase